MSIKRSNKTMKDDGDETAAIIKSKRMKKLLSSDKQIMSRDDDTVVANDIDGSLGVATVTGNNDGSSGKKEKPLDGIIFKYFNDFINPNKEIRLKSTCDLMQRLKRNNSVNATRVTSIGKDEETIQKPQGEMLYTLKRLIRGCGASTNVSRTGYFTSLVALLKTFDCTQIPNTDIFQVMQKELHVGSTLVNKEDADAVVGQLLVCLAILRSDRLHLPSSFDRSACEQIVQIVIQSTCHRFYHASLGYQVLTQLLQLITEEQFLNSVWPLLQKDLCRPWPKHTFHSIYALLIIEMKFPVFINKKLLKDYSTNKTLLNPDYHPHFYRVLYQHNNNDILKHPFLEVFADYMLKHFTNFIDFWSKTILTKLTNASKLTESITLKLITFIFNKMEAKEKTIIRPLLNVKFMQMFVGILKHMKYKKNLYTLHNEFLQALVNACRHLTDDKDKVAVIKCLILPPGIINIETFTNTRVINQLINLLNTAGVQELFDIYRGIFQGTLVKNPIKKEEQWLSNERIKAGYMMQFLLQHKAVANAYKWRSKQLLFLCTVGIFNVNDKLEICRKSSASEFSGNFSEQSKNIFYNCLLMQQKGNLTKQQDLLQTLVDFCHQQMCRKHPERYFHLKLLNDKIQHSWQQMYEVISKLHQMENQLEFVFRFILLNMGMQLFREPEVAIAAINDLIKCLQKMQDQQQQQQQKQQQQQTEENKQFNKKKENIKTDDNKRRQQLSANSNSEPDWIEVVMELFLHLLSQNNNALRLVVNSVFPHFCNNLNLNAIYQILSLLDMKDGNNPLSSNNQIDDEESSEMSGEEGEYINDSTQESKSDKEQLHNKKHFNSSNIDEEDSSDSDEDEDDNGNGGGDDDEDDDDDDDDDDDEEEEDDENDDDITEQDRLRNAVSQALMVNGAAAGTDDDCSSIDLNDMTEEEGQRLDAALANAFRTIKSSNKKKSKTKTDRIQTTTLMHFRIRLLDLLDIYLQQQQPSFLITIEIMLFVYQMLGYCTAIEYVDLKNRLEKFLNNLTNLKFHKILATTNDKNDEDLNEDHLVEYIRLIVEKKSTTVPCDLMNRMCNKCIIFLLNNLRRFTQQLEPQKLIKLFCDYIQEFINKRSPNLNNNFLVELFSLRSPLEVILQAAKHLVKCGLKTKTRIIRRIHVYELLTVLYKNLELFKSIKKDEQHLKCLNKMEKNICQYIQCLADVDNDTATRRTSNTEEENSQVSTKNSPKEFQVLLEFIHKANHTHGNLQLASKLTQPQTLTSIQKYACKTRLNSKQFYQRFCETFKSLSESKRHNNHHIQQDDGVVNDDVASETVLMDMEDNDSNNNQQLTTSSTKIVRTTKRKVRGNIDTRKAKKQAKLQRLAAVSNDFHNNIKDFKDFNGCNSSSSTIISSLSNS